uniref:Putative secreted protein n=1 Tax=Anopheles darlingi TaxID=43151 RepID=A0A2M4D214_ANODA
MVFDALGLLQHVLIAALAQRCINFLRRARQIRWRMVLRLTSVDDRMHQRVTLDDLLLPVAIDHRIETLERTATHQIPDTFLLDPEPLDLVVDVEEQRVVTGRVVARTHQEATRPSLHQHIDGLVLGARRMEPGKDRVRVDGRIQILDELAEDHTLLSGSMGRHPQPPIAHIVVHEEDVPLLERQLVRIGHLRVGKDRDHTLLVVHRFWRWYRKHQPFTLQQITA